MTCYVPTTKVSQHDLDQVREMTLAKIQAAPSHAEPHAPAAQRSAREARPNLDIASLKHHQPFQPDEHMDIPFALWDGAEIARQVTWVPDALYEEGCQWRITNTMYSSGVCEVRASLGKPPTRKQGSVDSSSISGEMSEQEREARFKQNISRSQRTLRSRATELAADHMLTLTKRGKFDSIDSFWSAWKRFCRLADKRFKHQGGWKFVVVPEQHKDGTYHAHVALRGYHSIEAIRILWYKALGGQGNERGENTPGSVNIRRFKKPRKGSSGAAVVRSIAAYIAKYVGKGFGAGLRGRRLFAAARGLNPHRIVKRISYHRGGLTELAAGLLGELFAGGASGDGEVFKWHRLRRDGTLQMCGFVLSTDWRVST